MFWLRYHWIELTAIIAPTVAAVTVSPWFGILTVLAGTSWIRHELDNRIPPIPPQTPDNRARVDQSA